MRECLVEGVKAVKTDGSTRYAMIEARKAANVVLTNVTFKDNECLNLVRDYYSTDDENKENNRAETATTKLQYCNVMNNKMTWMAYIRSNYSVAGGNISGNALSNALWTNRRI